MVRLGAASTQDADAVGLPAAGSCVFRYVIGRRKENQSPKWARCGSLPTGGEP
jgi:hypothetical protein